MRVSRTRAFDIVRGGARPVPAEDQLELVSFADDDDDGTDLHRLARGEVAPYQRTRLVKSRVTVPAEVASADD